MRGEKKTKTCFFSPPKVEISFFRWKNIFFSLAIKKFIQCQRIQSSTAQEHVGQWWGCSVPCGQASSNESCVSVEHLKCDWCDCRAECLILLKCSVAHSCPTLCDPMDCSTPGPLPTPRVYSNSCPLSWWCHPTISSSVILFSCPQPFPASGQPSHPLSFPSPALNLSLHQGLFKWVSSSHQVAKELEFSASASVLNEYSGLISFRMDWLDLLAVQESQESSPTPQFKSINSLALSFPYSPTLTPVHDYWKNHSLDYMDICWQSGIFAF